MYLIEKIQFETLQKFEDKLNSLKRSGYSVVHVFDYVKGGFNERNTATILFEQEREGSK